ncbi:hypothetical protein JAAARDRAFT_468440 [Jaapia argillacea MUCL 33604]|uniref:NADP-dependent oxidoreductase domain-containing protein n=1 Tax=Jaapia argillacea MUCL 33604 TaxID=933084 RepID=A0A067QJ81_9AGAM|nr:hypothetical protein JAAARDRAFT_468440 [Jaapia argillacea MUCL 33604]
MMGMRFQPSLSAQEVHSLANATDNVELAIETGFIHIDTAAIYKNEDSVGDAIKGGGFDREKLYIATKYDGGDIQREVRSSLTKLGLTQVDLYLIHFPSLVEKDMEGGWRELEKIKEDGLSRSIGVSNFNLEQMQELVKVARIKPAVNQIRLHPYNYAENRALLAYSAQHGIVTEAYSSLTPLTKLPGGAVDKPVAAAAKRLGATPGQVIFKWVESKGVVIVTTSSRKERLEEYLAVADIPALTSAEIAAIDQAGASGFSSETSFGFGFWVFILVVLAGGWFARRFFISRREKTTTGYEPISSS